MLLWTQDAYEAPQPRLGSWNPGFWLARAGQLPEIQAFILPSARPPPCATRSSARLAPVDPKFKLVPMDPGFPCGSTSKEFSCNAGDVSSIPVLGKVKVKSLSRIQLFATPWTVAYQAPPSVGFSRPEYCSGLPFPSPCVGKIPWKRERPRTPVFWPGEFHGLYSPWGCEELDTTEQLSLSLSLGSRLSAVSSAETCSGRTNPQTGPKVFTLQADSGGSKFQAYATATPATRIIQYCNMLV